MTLSIQAGWFDRHPLLQKIIGFLRTQPTEVYLVGGAVRDFLLERPDIYDLDFAVPDDGLAVARYVANVLKAAYYPLDPERGTGRVIYQLANAIGFKEAHLDFTTFRGSTLLADLKGRDFSINAMAISLTDPAQLIDPLKGLRDLEAGRIRVVSKKAFQHDPVRILRAVRQASELDFTIEDNTEQFLRQAVPDLANASPERRRDELLKLLNIPVPGQAMKSLRNLGILPYFLPEIEAMIGVKQSPPHYLDVFDHTVTALELWASMLRTGLLDIPREFRTQVQLYLNQKLTSNLSLQLLIALALLWHDSGKPLTYSEHMEPYAKIRFLGHERESAKIVRRAMKRFHFSNQAIEFVEKVVAHHMRPLILAQNDKISRRAMYRLFRDTSNTHYQAGVAVAIHALADHRATYPPGHGQDVESALIRVVHKLISGFFEQRDRVVDPRPLLTGHDLIKEFGLAEGRLIGLLLDRLKEAQAIGQVEDRDSAVAFIKADRDFVSYQEKLTREVNK